MKTEPLHPIKVGQPFDRVGMDLVGPLPLTKKGKSIYCSGNRIFN
jgi:hypothetical protein